MKILHLYRNFLGNDGTSYQTRQLVAAQEKLGHDVVTVFLKRPCPVNPPDRARHLRLHPLRPGLTGLRDLQGILRIFTPDVAHFSGTWIPIHQLWVAEVLRAGIPYVVTPHGNFSPYGQNLRFGGKPCYFYHVWRKKIWQRGLDIPLLRQAAGVHVHSRYEEELIQAVGVRRTFVAPTGFDAQWVHTRNAALRRIHKPVTFLHLGRLDIYHKGLDLICEVCQKIVERGLAGACKFLLVGPTVNESFQSLKEFAAKVGHGVMEMREAVTGTEKDRLWEEADYFLNLYRFAGIALAPSEALGQGIPLIASREGNLGDWVSSAGMGFVVPLDSEHIFEVIRKILDSPETDYSTLSRQAVAFARHFTWERAAEQVIEGYRKVL